MDNDFWAFETIFYHFCEFEKNALRRDGPTDRRTDGPTDGRTDGQSLLQRCMDASKNNKQREPLTICCLSDLLYYCPCPTVHNCLAMCPALFDIHPFNNNYCLKTQLDWMRLEARTMKCFLRIDPCHTVIPLVFLSFIVSVALCLCPTKFVLILVQTCCGNNLYPNQENESRKMQ